MKSDLTFDKLVRYILIVLVIFGFVISISFNRMDMALGIIGGGAVGIIHFSMLARSVYNITKMNPSRAMIQGGVSSILRILGSAALIAALAATPAVNIIGAFIGYFLLRIAIYICPFVESCLSGRGDNNG